LKKGCKVLSFFVACSIAMGLGDKFDVLDKMYYPVKYRKIKVDKDCYQEPFKIKKKYLVNKDGFLEVYIGDGKNFYKVKKGFRVNERSFEEILKEEIKKIVKKGKSWYKFIEEILD